MLRVKVITTEGSQIICKMQPLLWYLLEKHILHQQQPENDGHAISLPQLSNTLFFRYGL